MGPSSSSPEVDPPSGERGAPGAGAQPKAFDFDAIVVGTGFGGAVTACRLAQAGLKVRILERGRRYALTDLPALPQPNEFMPDSRRWTWGGSQGLWDIRNLEGVTVAQAAAYGGGSLVYANVHLRPPREVFTDAWPKDCQGRPEKLDDYFDLAAHMLDVAPIPEPWRKIGKTKAMAEAFGKAAVEPTDVFFPPLAIQFPTGAAEDVTAADDWARNGYQSGGHLTASQRSFHSLRLIIGRGGRGVYKDGIEGAVRPPPQPSPA